MTAEKKRRIVSGVTLGVFFAAMIAATVLSFDTLTDAVNDPAGFREQIESFGFAGKLIFTLLMAAQVVLAIIPGHPFEVAGGFCFGVFEGTLLTMLGALLGSVVAFFIARFLGLGMVKAFYSEEKLQKVFFLKASKQQTAFSLLFFLLPGVPKDMLAYFLGVTKMRFTTFLLISTVGRFPGILVAVLAGAAAQTRSTTVIIVFAVLLLLLIAASVFLYKQTEKKKKTAESTDAN